MKKILFFIVWCICGLQYSYAQEKIGKEQVSTPNTEEKTSTVEFGIKGGFNSSLFLVSHLSINGIKVDQTQNNYKIGFTSALFMRLNFGRHYIQPELSYNISRGSVEFEEPDDGQHANDILPDKQHSFVTSTIHSFDTPILYGYQIINEGPYKLSVFGGPKIRWILNGPSQVDYENFEQENIQEKFHVVNFSFTTGISISISRILLDFRYDIAFRNISKSISHSSTDNSNLTRSLSDNITSNNEIKCNRRDNILSFSLGVFF